VDVLTGASLLLGMALQIAAPPAPASSAMHARPPADSARMVREARSAQASFESFRRAQLPRGVGRPSGPCDFRIGRYCYWRGDDDDEVPPTEPAAIRERRDVLVRLLDSASDALPGDPWLGGQRVRYLVEAEHYDDAVGYTSRCAAGASWCAALAGYALHAADRFGEADSAYRRSLALMNAAERCRWLDVSPLLDGALAERFARTDCDRRQEVVRRIFWLAAPLYMVSGTDVLTEHLARLTWARMAEGAAAADGEPWGDDVRELVLRYGLPRWYSQVYEPFSSTLMPSIVGHDAGMPYDFLPSPHALDHLGHATDDDWDLGDPLAATGYAPSFARSLHNLPNQVAVFWRGDSALVVAAWDARADTTLLGRPLNAALVLVDGDSVRAIRRDTAAGVVGHITTVGKLDSGLVSLELLASHDRSAARARVGLPARPAGRVSASDLLFYAPASASADELALVRDSVLTSLTLPTSRGVGVYWELYGLHPSETVHYSLTVERTGESWLRRAAQRLHLSDPAGGLRLQWEEAARPHDGIVGRGVRLDLSRLQAGRYRAELETRVAGEGLIMVSRELDVR
jgi:hypothetical protein